MGTNPLLIWNRKREAVVAKVAIVLHYMILKARCDGYKSNLHIVAYMAKIRGHFIDENGNEKEFKLHWKDAMVRTGSGQTDSIFWSRQISKVDAHVKDAVGHLVLKRDLIDYICDKSGNDQFP